MPPPNFEVLQKLLGVHVYTHVPLLDPPVNREGPAFEVNIAGGFCVS